MLHCLRINSRGKSTAYMCLHCLQVTSPIVLTHWVQITFKAFLMPKKKLRNRHFVIWYALFWTQTIKPSKLIKGTQVLHGTVRHSFAPYVTVLSGSFLVFCYCSPPAKVSHGGRWKYTTSVLQGDRLHSNVQQLAWLGETVWEAFWGHRHTLNFNSPGCDDCYRKGNTKWKRNIYS